MLFLRSDYVPSPSFVKIYFGEYTAYSGQTELATKVARVVADIILLYLNRTSPDNHWAVFVVDIEGRVDADDMDQAVA